MNEREDHNGNGGGSQGASARSLGDCVRDFMKSSGLSQRRTYRDLPQDWSDIVGPDLARGSRLLGVQRGTLLVEVQSPAIQQELTVFLKETILSRVKERYPNKNVFDMKCIHASEVRSSRRPQL